MPKCTGIWFNVFDNNLWNGNIQEIIMGSYLELPFKFFKLFCTVCLSWLTIYPRLSCSSTNWLGCLKIKYWLVMEIVYALISLPECCSFIFIGASQLSTSPMCCDKFQRYLWYWFCCVDIIMGYMVYVYWLINKNDQLIALMILFVNSVTQYTL